jgi:hypothetical protein
LQRLWKHRVGITNEENRRKTGFTGPPLGNMLAKRNFLDQSQGKQKGPLETTDFLVSRIKQQEFGRE